MKKLALALSFVMMLLLIAACGDGNGNDSGNQENSNQEETNKDNETPDTGKDDQAGNGKNQEMTYSINGEKKTETATYTESDELDYALYVLPGFELTSEEPGKDKVSLKDNDAVSMRIELLESPDWNTLENNIPLELEYFGTDIVNPDDDNLQIDSAKIYEASNDEERVTIYLVQSDKMPLKLTMFTPADQDYREAFVQMAKTITNK